MTATQEMPGVERRLFGEELGNRASELMGPIVETLKQEPSVLSKLANAYFRHNHGHEMNDISFMLERGDKKFEITHFDGRGVACSREKPCQ